MTDHTLYVQGKKVGTTNISVFGADKRLVAVVDLEVALDAASLHTRIAASTGSRNINVASANGASGAERRGERRGLGGAGGRRGQGPRAEGAARGSGPPVIDAMRVAPSQQVMLKVRFLEVDRTAGRDLGVNLVRRKQERDRRLGARRRFAFGDRRRRHHHANQSVRPALSTTAGVTRPNHWHHRAHLHAPAAAPMSQAPSSPCSAGCLAGTASSPSRSARCSRK